MRMGEVLMVFEESINWYITSESIWQYLVKLITHVAFDPNMLLLSLYLKLGMANYL